MFKRKRKFLEYFDENITPSCKYCENYKKDENGNRKCSLKQSKNKICKKFIYDPLKREPRVIPVHHNYNHKDITL